MSHHSAEEGGERPISVLGNRQTNCPSFPSNSDRYFLTVTPPPVRYCSNGDAKFAGRGYNLNEGATRTFEAFLDDVSPYVCVPPLSL